MISLKMFNKLSYKDLSVKIIVFLFFYSIDIMFPTHYYSKESFDTILEIDLERFLRFYPSFCEVRPVISKDSFFILVWSILFFILFLSFLWYYSDFIIWFFLGQPCCSFKYWVLLGRPSLVEYQEVFFH